MKVSSRSFRGASLLVVFFMIFTQAFSGTFLFAQSSPVTGKIQSITPIAGGQFEIVLKTDKGTSKFVIDGASTLIQQMVPAKDVKKGQKIARAPFPGVTGMKGAPAKKAPFQDMAPAVKEALGIPDVPEIPAVPDVPSVPKVPQVPDIPNVPKVPKVPQVQKAPEFPNIPPGALGAPKPAGAGSGAPAPQAAGGGAAPEAGGEAPSGQPSPSADAEQRPPDQDYPEPPKEARSSVMKKSAISAPTTLPKISGKTVVSLEESSEGMKVELEGEDGKREAAVLPANEKVMRLLTVKDLAKNMSVTLDVAPDGDDNFVQRVTVV